MPFIKSIAFIVVSWFATSIYAETTNTQFYSTPTAEPTNVRASTYSGCYATSVPMINHGPYTFQTPGNCQHICYTLENNVMGLGNGTDCWCGDMLPPVSAKVSDDQCSTPCAGYGLTTCGGGTVWAVYLTGFTLNKVDVFNPSSSSSSSIASGPTVTASPTSAPSKKGSSSVGIVVGVIVGIVAVGALVGAGFLFMRRRQRHQMEEYKKQNDVASFVGDKDDIIRPSMWAPDQRLNGAADGRRVSVGSIADNQDYSRRILQVRNPDGF